MAADNSFAPLGGGSGSNCFKEAVCIDTGRIYDSCSDKDCLEDLRVTFTDAGQQIIDQAISVKSRHITVLNVFMDVEPVPFNTGFYSVDMTFFFRVELEAYLSPMCSPTPVCGLATFSKKVILYGSEGSVKTFSSVMWGMPDESGGNFPANLPLARVQVVDPICLACRLCEYSPCCGEPIVNIPDRIAAAFEGNFAANNDNRNNVVLITIGLFSIVQLEREVQMMVPIYDFSIPDKECTTTTDDPCELFKQIKFPVNEFFPPRLDPDACDETPPTV